MKNRMKTIMRMNSSRMSLSSLRKINNSNKNIFYIFLRNDEDEYADDFADDFD